VVFYVFKQKKVPFSLPIIPLIGLANLHIFNEAFNCSIHKAYLVTNFRKEKLTQDHISFSYYRAQQFGEHYKLLFKALKIIFYSRHLSFSGSLPDLL